MAKIRIKPLYIGIAFVLIVVFLAGFAKFMDLRAKNIALDKDIERLEQENTTLYKEKKKREEDIEYVEKVARESMGVTREGEIPIKIE